MMRGTARSRLVFAALSVLFLLLCVVAIHGEDARPWMPYQKKYVEMLREKAQAKLQEATAKNDTREIAHWQRTIDEASHWQTEVKQVYLEDAKVADRCTTCHLGIDNPLFADAPQPFRTHPDKLLEVHDVNRIGCTLCHDGQGLATTVEGAHGLEANWSRPLLPKAYLESACARCHEVVHGLRGAEVAAHGADLFMDKGCYGCHDVKGLDYLPKYGPPLTPLKLKLLDTRGWVYNWVKDPAHISPQTAMPNPKISDEEVGKITAFLLTMPEGKPYPHVPLDGASAQDGEKLFTERGCRGCHAIKADERSISPRVPNLVGVGSKVTPDWLDRWIADPKSYNADTAMPKIELTDAERHNVVAYLLTLKRSEPLPAPPDLSQFKPEDGKQLVKRYECFGCHAIEGFEKVRPSVPNLGDFAHRPVAELDFALTTDVPRTKWDWLQRKLRDPRAYETDKIKLLMPVMPTTDEEAQALITYVLGLDATTLPARYVVPATQATRDLRTVSWMTTHLNCNGCHPLNGKEPRLAEFVERKSRVAPTLDGVGERLQGDYFYKFLLEPKQVRPWLTLRMPTFGFSEPQARTVVEGFAAMGHVTNPYTYVAKTQLPEDRVERGFKRFKHYKCIQCHPSSIEGGLPEGLEPDDLSINLSLAKQRLRPEWIADFLAKPKQIAGNQTRMPTVFYTVDGTPKVDDPKKDIDDIVLYLMGMTESPEVTLKRFEDEKEAEEKKEKTDWSTMDY